jgi:excisionase family DNA binding protein
MPDRTRQTKTVTLLTPKQAGDQLGASDMHIYRLIESGELAAVDIAQPGSRKSKTRIRSDDLDAYIDRHTRRIGGSSDERPATSTRLVSRRGISREPEPAVDAAAVAVG